MNTMMALAVFYDEKKVKLMELEQPKITNPTQVKIKVLEVGVCGTDKHICNFSYGAPPTESQHLILGHEALGIVVETGPKAHNVKVGDMVAITVRRECGDKNCQPCLLSHPDYCSSGQFLERGINGYHGFMSEYIVEEQHNLIWLPHELRNCGVLLEPLGVVLKALENIKISKFNMGITKKKKMLIIGAGSIGILAAMCGIIKGIEVFVYSTEQTNSLKGEIIEAIGAKYICRSDCEIKKIPEIAGDINIVFDAAGVGNLIPDFIQTLASNGIFILVGICGGSKHKDCDFSIFSNDLVVKNQTIVGSIHLGHKHYVEAVSYLLEFKEKMPDQLNKIITSRNYFHEHESVMSVILNGGGIKNVINFDK